MHYNSTEFAGVITQLIKCGPDEKQDLMLLSDLLRNILGGLLFNVMIFSFTLSMTILKTAVVEGITSGPEEFVQPPTNFRRVPLVKPMTDLVRAENG